MMLAPRQSLTSRLALLVLGCAVFSVCACVERYARAQEEGGATTPPSETERGIALYRKGDLNGAIKTLSAVVKKDKDDAEAWHFLGLSHYSSGDAKSARKAFEVEVKLSPASAAAHTGLAYSFLLDKKFGEATLEAERALAFGGENADAHYIIGVKHFRDGARATALAEAENSIKTNPNFAPAYLLKLEVLLATSEWAIVILPDESEEERVSRLKEAREGLAAYLKLSPLSPDRELMQELLQSLDSYLKPKTPANDKTEAEPKSSAFAGVLPPQDVTQKARLLTKPEPQCGKPANQAAATGTVVIKAVFAADGRVKHIRVVQTQPYGLTDAAIRAARAIRFEPALKNGRPVSQFIQIEYNFWC